jgi:hypothetical protein
MISLPHPIPIQIQVSVIKTVYFVFQSVILLLVRQKFEYPGAVLGGKHNFHILKVGCVLGMTSTLVGKK